MKGNEYYLDDNETYLGTKSENSKHNCMHIDEDEAVLQFYFNCLDSGGEHTTVLEYLFKYLTLIKDKNWPSEHSGEYYCIMHILEKNDLIKSDVSIRVPWLTEKGQLAYDDIKNVIEIPEIIYPEPIM
jgi:hypothetical protein